MSTLFTKGNIEMGEGKIDESFREKDAGTFSTHCNLYNNKLELCIKLAVR